MHWWKITNKNGDSAELLLYGSIGDSGLSDNSSKDFAKELQQLRQISNITVRLNSYGGEVTAAQAVYSIIKNHPAYITVIVDGIAASAASLVAMAGDRIIMPVNALMMIHNPVAYIGGDSADMLHASKVLEKTKQTMINVYCERTGKDQKVISDMMDTETWFTAEEALYEGFIDEVDTNTCVNFFEENNGNITVNGLPVDLGIYKNIPVSALARVSIVQPRNGGEKEDIIMDLEQLKTQYPDVYNQVYNAGVTAERERIKAIDQIRAAGYEDIKLKAKYETLVQAGAAAIEIVNAQAGKIAEADKKRTEDIDGSMVNAIKAGDAQTIYGEEDAKALVQKAVEAANKNIVRG